MLAVLAVGTRWVAVVVAEIAGFDPLPGIFCQ